MRATLSPVLRRLVRYGLATCIGFGLLNVYAKESVMSDTQTYCIGRFLVDVPKEAEINGQGYEFMFGRVESEKTALDAKGFAEKMLQREAEIKEKKLKDIYQLDKAIAPFPDGMIFLASRKAFGHLGYGFDAYRLEKKVLFSISQTGFDPDRINSVVSRLQTDFLPNLRARQQDEIPTEPGFCIKDGFIADDGSKAQAEYGQIGFLFKAWPDVLVVFTTRENGDKLEMPLLERFAKSSVHTTFADVIHRVKTLRQGPRNVGTLMGQELLHAIPTDAGFYIHQFSWDSVGQPNAAFAPNVHVEMFSGEKKNGQPQRPSLSDAQALKLFDSIVNSIRLRPTGPAKVSSVEPPPPLPLGELASTGTVCPQTGWWQCNDNTRPVQGGNRQFFRAGSNMPPAIWLGEQNLWQKLKGEQPSHPVATVWRLVDYEAAPVAAVTTAPADTPATNAAPSIAPSTDNNPPADKA